MRRLLSEFGIILPEGFSQPYRWVSGILADGDKAFQDLCAPSSVGCSQGTRSGRERRLNGPATMKTRTLA